LGRVGHGGGPVVALGTAAVVGTSVADYTAVLVVFSIWMLWFVLACIEWIRRAEC
jgi:hypothetical protein